MPNIKMAKSLSGELVDIINELTILMPFRRHRRRQRHHREDDWNVLSVNYANLKRKQSHGFALQFGFCSVLFFSPRKYLFFFIAWYFFLFFLRLLVFVTIFLKWLDVSFIFREEKKKTECFKCFYWFEQSVSLSLLRTAYKKWLNTPIRFIGFCIFLQTHVYGKKNAHR